MPVNLKLIIVHLLYFYITENLAVTIYLQELWQDLSNYVVFEAITFHLSSYSKTKVKINDY